MVVMRATWMVALTLVGGCLNRYGVSDRTLFLRDPDVARCTSREARR